MHHLILAFYLLAMIAGTASITQALLSWQRYRKAVIRRFACFLFSLFLILAGFTVDLYAQVAALSDEVCIRAFVWVLQAAGSILFIVICPFLFHSLVGRTLSARQKAFFFAFDACVCLLAFVNLAAPRLTAVPPILAGALFAMILYGLVFTIIHLHEIGERVLKQALRIFLFVTVIFFPLIIIDAAMTEIAFLAVFQFMNNLAQPVYFLVINCLSIVFGFRYLNRPAYSEKGRLTEYFLAAFGVTTREAEIIGLVVEGASMKEIGRKLFISPKTAENHVYNIYQKLGVRNRVQMFQMISANAIE